ncbi:MFS transporter [Oxalobacteraceae bacterium CAVE-383]|nr:MFS transporter [Oxalobacteraceae bacterium CAVE-383]
MNPSADKTTQPVSVPVSEASISGAMTFLLAVSVGLIVANIYYSQPLIGPIARELGMSPQTAGLIATLTQLGYGAGLLLLVPLGDLLENRKLTIGIIGLGMIASLTVASVSHTVPFLLACIGIGIGSVSVQLLVPYAAHLAPEAVRGRVVGKTMSGLMLGIMLARPVASLITDLWSWQAVFYMAAGIMVVLGMVLWRALPPRQPEHESSYGALLASLGHLVMDTPILRRRAAYHAALFGAFSLFWTAVPLLLASPAYGLSQTGIALFALAGVAGAISAPIAGAMADRGWSRPATGIAMAIAALAFLLSMCAPPGTRLGLGLLVLSAILLDFSVTANLVLGQRAIFILGAALRSRLNGLYIAIFFVGGALGSALAGWGYAHGGWTLTAWIGFALPALVLPYYAMEWRGKR